MSYRVDNIPLLLKVPYWIFGYGGGVLYFLFMRFLSLTTRTVDDGLDQLSPNEPYIFALWHDQNLPAFVARFFERTKRPCIMMNHPMWHMKPIHVVLYFFGVKKLIMGSSGNSGREAADTLVRYLKEGYSTYINPDGPAGPARVLKKGVLHMSAQSGVAVVPVRFTCSNAHTLKQTWEGKRLPLPFSTITVHYGEPIRVTNETLEHCAQALRLAMIDS